MPNIRPAPEGRNKAAHSFIAPHPGLRRWGRPLLLGRCPRLCYSAPPGLRNVHYTTMSNATYGPTTSKATDFTLAELPPTIT